jgi:hypothetical protein
LAVAAFVVIAVVAMIRRPSLPELAKSIRVGDGKSQVKKILGRPLEVLNSPPEEKTNYIGDLLFGQKETWVYGKSLALGRSDDFPYVRLDLKLRLFGPLGNDVAIEFGKDGRVSGIRIPTDARQP